jgi:hypothetical protein
MQTDSDEVETLGPLRCATVELRAYEIVELDDDLTTALVRIPRKSIVRVELGSGFQAERPLLEGLFGLVLVIGSAWVFYNVAGFPRSFACMATLGFWALYRSMKRGAFLRVEIAGGGRRKLLFRSQVDRGQLEAFCQAAQSRFGCPIALKLP